MEIFHTRAVVNKFYESKKRALGSFEALYDQNVPKLFFDTQYGYVSEHEKEVAIISDIEYSIITEKEEKIDEK